LLPFLLPIYLLLVSTIEELEYLLLLYPFLHIFCLSLLEDILNKRKRQKTKRFKS
jgi:hypothetical protein